MLLNWQLKARFLPLQETFLGVQPGWLNETVMTRVKADSTARSAQPSGCAVTGAGGLLQSRGSPAAGGTAGQDAKPELDAQNLPPARALAQTVAVPPLYVDLQRKVLYLPACATPSPRQVVAVI